MGGKGSISDGCDTYKHPLYEATPCHHLVFLIFEASADACAGCCVAMDTVVCEAFSKQTDLFVHLQREEKEKSHHLCGC